MSKSLLIYNPAAGRGSGKRERQVREAARHLGAGGLDVELAATSGPGSATSLAREAAQAQFSPVFACGGDGTVNEVANGLAGTPAPLGLLPGGTANILAKELSLPHDPVLAARQYNSWQARRIALGKATWRDESAGGAMNTRERYFVCVAGIGFDAYILHKLRRSFASRFGVAAYGWEAFRQLLRFSFPRFVASVNGREIRATFAAAQRTSRYAGWVRMAPRQHVFTPAMTLCFFQSSRRFRYFAYAGAVVLGRHAQFEDVEEIESTLAELTAERDAAPIRFELDGELAGFLPVRLEVVPDALTLLVPGATK